MERGEIIHINNPAYTVVVPVHYSDAVSYEEKTHFLEKVILQKEYYRGAAIVGKEEFIDIFAHEVDIFVQASIDRGVDVFVLNDSVFETRMDDIWRQSVQAILYLKVEDVYTFIFSNGVTDKAIDLAIQIGKGRVNKILGR